MDWRKHRRNTCRLWAGALLAMALGCDDRRDVPPITGINPPPATTQAAPAIARPTTQELVSAPRKKLVLGSFPLTMEVPPGWKLTAQGSGVWLEGDAPHGEIRIQLIPQGESLKHDTVLAMDKVARVKAAAEPKVLQVSPLKPLAPSMTVQKMEKREFLHDLPFVKEDGTTERVDRVDWGVYVFVPQGNDFNLDVLEFSGLSIQQYEKDQEFLEHIIRSLHYDATHGALE